VSISTPMLLLPKPNFAACRRILSTKFFSRALSRLGLWTVTNRKPVMSKKEKPSPLKKLLKAWTSAGPEDRQAFLDLVAAEARARASDRTHAPVPEPVPGDAAALIANGRYLLPSTIERIEAVMRARKLSPAGIMAELGFSSRDASLTRALAMKAALRLSVIAALADWLATHESDR
jgi:hypothetical protein